MIKRIIITILIISIIVLSGCINLDNYITIEEYNSLKEAHSNAVEEYSNLKYDYNSLKVLNYDLQNKVNSQEEVIVKYQNLISNLNELLDNVYYGYGSNSNWESDGFTAFSIEYKGKYYIITAGHCVHYKLGNIDNGLYTTLKIKDDDGKWIYPKLLTYENDFNGNRDYAVLYSDKVEGGLEYNLDNSNHDFILGQGSNNILKEFNIYNLVEGESGSLIINISGEVMGIATGQFVDIDVVLEAIDNLGQE